MLPENAALHIGSRSNNQNDQEIRGEIRDIGIGEEEIEKRGSERICCKQT